MKLSTFFLLCFWNIHLLLATNVGLLETKANEIALSAKMIKHAEDLDFPQYSNRSFWKSIPIEIQHLYISEAEALLDYQWPSIKATDYLAFVTEGDRRDSLFSSLYNSLTSLVMGELIEGNKRFIPQIINGVWFYLEQTWWGLPAHFYLQKGKPGLPDQEDIVIDHHVGDVACLLSWTWLLFNKQFDEVHPLINNRLIKEIHSKVLIPYYQREDFWWQGFDRSRPLNNWNPWITSNILTTILIMENDPKQKINGIKKALKSLDYFLTDYADDGGCDEGPSYWFRAGGALYQCLSLMKEATGGRFDVFNHIKIKNIANYICNVYIDSLFFVNFADADASIFARPEIVYGFGDATGNDGMIQLGKRFATLQGIGKDKPFYGRVDEQIDQMKRYRQGAFAMTEKTTSKSAVTNFWYPSIQLCGGRDHTDTSDGFFFAAKGGHNAESHNHNDVGTFILYYNGHPCIIDLGREKYTAKTFSNNRYKLWNYQSQYHNLPTINGMLQCSGRDYKAKDFSFKADSRKVYYTVDISSAYPKEANVNYWKRTYELKKGESFIFSDAFQLKRLAESTTFNLMLYCDINEIRPGVVHLSGYDNSYRLEMTYDANLLSLNIEEYDLSGSKLKNYWNRGVKRMVFSYKGKQNRDKLTFKIRPL